jgi:UDP-3-O-[3-hydroxymyristoyl] glucosamine N-acyltransferase
VEFRLGELAERLKLELSGDAGRPIHGISGLSASRPDTITFLADPRQRAKMSGTRAAAVILRREDREHCPVDALISADPYLSYAHLSALFAWHPAHDAPIHPSAVVDSGARLGDGVRIGANAVIADGVTLDDGVEIGAGTVVLQGTRIGASSRLLANVTVHHDCVIGQRVLIHSGAVIGDDGFGFAKNVREWVKIHQLGRVVIGDDVEIGSNTCIDRGSIEDTVIGDGVKLDNLIMVAHNVKVGARTVMAGCVGIAGSADIGEDCMLGGGVGVSGHLRIPAGTTVMGMSLVAGSLREPGVYASGLSVLERKEFQRNAVRFRQLDDLAKRLAALEKALKDRDL